MLQTMATTNGHQMHDLGKRGLFEAFLEADQVFKKYNYPCTLAVLAEGIDSEPMWVDHIKRNLHRYTIELHGNRHVNYKAMPRQEFIDEMKEAIDKIENTFGNKLTTFYPPWGRKGERDDLDVFDELSAVQYVQLGNVDEKLWFYD